MTILGESMSMETLVARRWKPHPIMIGFWSRDGEPYITTREAYAIEFAEELARERIKREHPERAGRPKQEQRKTARDLEEERAYWEAESRGRREAYERHRVVPKVDVVKEQAEARKRHKARDEREAERRPIVGKPIKWTP